MKKNGHCKSDLIRSFCRSILSTQNLLKLNWSVFFIFFACIHVFAEGYSQNAKVNVNFRSVKLNKALSQLENKGDVRLLYNEASLPAKEITFTGENLAVTEVLAKILEGTNLKYRQFDSGLVVITSSEKAMQDLTINGRVTDVYGTPLIGVTVRIEGSTTGVTTDESGNFLIKAPEQSKLVFSYIGFMDKVVTVNGQSPIEVRLEEADKSLEAVVITGYSAQRKKDIIGAVSVIKSEELKATPSSNIASQLQGRASGVSVSSSGDPGSSSVVRIRGFSSYGNNNPLYVIDGVPTTNASRLNPQDVESIQVLKDASSASIYGSRAANGVIIVTTKQGKSDKTSLSYESYVGVQSLPYGKVPEMMNTNDLMKYLTLTMDDNYVDPVFGKHGSFSIPDYYIVSNNFRGGVSASDPRANPELYSIADYSNIYQILKTSEGTDWFDAMSQKGVIQSHQINISGGGEKSNFAVGMNYFNQEGIFKHTGFDRYSIRSNSSFKPTSFLTVGENIQVSYDNRKGDNGLVGEQSAWANAYRSAAFTPVHDINGGYGGSLIGGTSGISWNPVAYLNRRKDWYDKSLRVFGNAFAEVKFMEGLSFRTSFGVDAASSNFKRAMLQEYERTERRTTTQLNEGSNNYINWTWTNTVNYHKQFEDHDFKVLAGTEAVRNTGRGLQASVNGYDFETDDFLTLNTGIPRSLADLSISNTNLGNSSLFSYFGRLDYTFKERYLLNATFRRDGSSLFGDNVKYGNFPSFGAGWRISEEQFLQNYSWLSDLKLRAGWGQMGSISNVPILNQYSTFVSNAKESFYDIDGVGAGSTQGFGLNRVGNQNTKWETSETLNMGVDLSIFAGLLSLSVDVYKKDTRDLLVPQLRNSLEPMVSLPLIN